MNPVRWLARVLGMTEGQAYTVVIGLVLASLLAAGGLPPTLQNTAATADSGTPSAAAPTDAPAEASEDAAPDASSGTAEDAPPTSSRDSSPPPQRRASAPVPPRDGAQPPPSEPAPESSPHEGGDVVTPARGRGVTSSAIKVGLLQVDEGASTFFGWDPGRAQTNTAFWIDYLNEQGGVVGKKLQLHTASFDPLDDDSVRAACRTVTQDVATFLVLDPHGYPDPLCITEENRTLLLTDRGLPEAYYERSEGRLLDWAMAGERVARSHVQLLHESGALTDRTIGVVHGDGDVFKQPAEQALVPQLELLGYEVADTTELASDVTGAAAQVPVAVAEQRAAGVDFVFLHTSVLHAAQWTQEADKQLWAPQYAMTDATIRDMSVGIPFENFSAWPSSLQVIGHSVALEPANANAGVVTPLSEVQESCKRIYERETGVELDAEADDPEARARLHDVVRPCRDLMLVKALLEGVDPQLTMAAFSQRASSVGSLDVWTARPGADWLPGHLDAANALRELAWSPSCPHDPDNRKRTGCFVPTTQFATAPSERSRTHVKES